MVKKTNIKSNIPICIDSEEIDHTQHPKCKQDNCNSLASADTDNMYCLEHYITWWETYVKKSNTNLSKELGQLYQKYVTTYELTDEDINYLVECPCYYCGQVYDYKLELTEKDKFSIIACCKHCLQLKVQLFPDDLITLCKNIKDNYRTDKINILLNEAEARKIMTTVADRGFRLSLDDCINTVSKVC